MIDVKTPDSPGWWLARCSAKLAEQRKRVDPLFARYEGNPPIPASVKGAPEAARHFYQTSRTAFAEMIVKAVRYRLRVVGILTDATTDEVGDAAAFDLWRRSGMAARQHDVHRNSLIAGDGYVLCAQYQGEVAATSEDPRQVVTIHDPVRDDVILAAAKLFHDDVADRDLAYLYRPEPDGDGGRRWVARRTRTTTTSAAIKVTASGWEWDPDAGGETGELVPVPMPFIRYPNEEGVSEFERHRDILDRIDHLVLQGMVIATLQAFKQRAIKVDPKDMPDVAPETGADIDYNEVLAADPGALWKLPATADLWESGAVDLTPITNMVTKEIERMSAVTFTPMSMFTPDAANQSATGAALVKEGLTTKVEDKQARLGESHAMTVALLARIAGRDDLTDPYKIRVRWAPAERYALSEKADAGMKAKATGVPWRTIMRTIWQMEPEEIERMASERMDDAVLTSTIAAMSATVPAAAPAAEPAIEPEPAAETPPEPVV